MPTVKYSQGYNDRLDDSLGAKHGKKSQSMKDRRDESAAMSEKLYGHKYGGDHSMDICRAPAGALQISHGETGSVHAHLSKLISK